MSFAEIYKNVKPGIVAVVQQISPNPDFPEIIGTGFIAAEDGVVVTNNHVIKAINRLPKRKGAPGDERPIKIMYLHDIPGKGIGQIFFDVEGVTTIGREKPVEGYYYGPDVPDIGLIYLKVKGLPFLEIESDFHLQEGEEVFTSGYPLGTRTLRAPGWIHQINPVLQRGLIAAIQPFPCAKPHGLLIDMVAQPGSSGSPIFNPQNGKVTALLYGGIIGWESIFIPNRLKLPYQKSTSLTLAIPAYIVSDILRLSKTLYNEQTGQTISRDVSKYLTLEQILKTYPEVTLKPKTPSSSVEAIPASDIEFPF